MDLHIGHSMSSPTVCSRRELSKIAQGKRSAALGKGQWQGSSALEGWIDALAVDR